MSTTQENSAKTAAKAVAETPTQSVTRQLNALVDSIARALPKAVKDQADRFVARACFTFHSTPALHKCRVKSFVDCVLAGAQVGLPIDGKLGYAVPFKNGAESDRAGRDVFDAQFLPGYIGLVTVARRSGQIQNAFADIICKNDRFTYGRQGPECVLEHVPPTLGQDRGDPIGAYCVIAFPDATWTHSVMSIAELDAIRGRSKAKNSGPWVTDKLEMYKKTVTRRAVKLYCSDPDFVMACNFDDREYDDAEFSPGVEEAGDTRRARRSSRGLPAPREATQFERDIAASTAGGFQNGAGAHAETVEVPKRKPGRPRKEQAAPTPPAEAPTKGETAPVDFDGKLGDICNEIQQMYEARDLDGVRRLYDRECGPDGTLPIEAVAEIERRVKGAITGLEAIARLEREEAATPGEAAEEEEFDDFPPSDE